MKYKTKSIIMGRKKKANEDDNYRPCFVALYYKINDPHKSGNVPDKILDFEQIDRVDIVGLDVSYLLAGNDIVVNNLEYVEIEEDDNHRVHIKGKQGK